MDAVEGAATFQKSGAEYDAFMGRYSRSLAPRFMEWAGLIPGQSVVDVGCGPGALTGVLVDRLGVEAVRACDPSPPFVEECRRRHPGVDVRHGRAEELPFEAASSDSALAQLVLHFVSDAEAAAREMRRVVRPGGVVAACSWDFAEGMEMLRHFWNAALALDSLAPDEVGLRFGAEGEFGALFAEAGFTDVAESTLEVTSSYVSFDELWAGFLAGIGPAGSYTVRQPPDRREALREGLFREVGSPRGAFELRAVARAGRARAPITREA